MLYRRLRIPTALPGQVFKPRGTRLLTEWRETLNTKGAAAAKRLCPAALARGRGAGGAERGVSGAWGRDAALEGQPRGSAGQGFQPDGRVLDDPRG